MEGDGSWMGWMECFIYVVGVGWSNWGGRWVEECVKPQKVLEGSKNERLTVPWRESRGEHISGGGEGFCSSELELKSSSAKI